MNHEIRLDLVLTGFTTDPREISSILALQPSTFWLKGEQVGKSELKRRTNGWVLSSGLDRSAEFEKHVEAIFAKIDPVKQRFSTLPSTTEVELSCAAYVYHGADGEDEEHNTPSLHLDLQTVTLLNQIRAEFDVDLYVLPK